MCGDGLIRTMKAITNNNALQVKYRELSLVNHNTVHILSHQSLPEHAVSDPLVVHVLVTHDICPCGALAI